MIVEIIGKPGVGKTTVAGELVDALRAEGISVRCELIGSEEEFHPSRPLRNLRRMRRLAAMPALAIATGRRARTRAMRADLMRVVNRESHSRAVLDLPHGVVLIDEGTLHKLCLLHAEGRIDRPLELARWVRPPDLCVALNADDRDVLERIRTRVHPSRIDRMPEPDLELYLTRYAEAIRVLEQRLTCPFIHVDTSATGAANTLCEAIEAHLR